MALIRHLALRCSDMEKTKDFYQTAFGWELIDYRPNGKALDLSDGVCNVTLIQQPDDCQRPRQEEGNEYIHFGVIVDDLAACRKRLEEWGAEFATESIKQPGSAEANVAPETSFKILDPDGNVVDVTRNRNEWRGVSMP
ncbi:MAG: VOC family protein [Planctomycetes bacterium]|nr:VOC family protein [Planctomycetota bacterium]